MKIFYEGTRIADDIYKFSLDPIFMVQTLYFYHKRTYSLERITYREPRVNYALHKVDFYYGLH